MTVKTAAWQGRPIELIESEKGSLHCFQCCTIIAFKALKNINLSMADAERLTGYVPGRETWPHQAFLSFAEAGLHVTSIEELNPHFFIENPEKEIRRLFTDPKIGDYILQITDQEKEKALLNKCIDHPNVSFESRDPTLNDIYNTLQNDGLVIATVDYSQLHGSGSYAGHMVLVNKINDTHIWLYDPGPPGHGNWQVTHEVFLKALMPDGAGGQLILLKP